MPARGVPRRASYPPAGSDGVDPVHRTRTCFSGRLRPPRPHRRHGNASGGAPGCFWASRARRASPTLTSCVPQSSGAILWLGVTHPHIFSVGVADRVSKVDASPVAARRDAQDAFDAVIHALGVVSARFSALEFVTRLIESLSRASAWTRPCSLSALSSWHAPRSDFSAPQRHLVVSRCAAAIRKGSRHGTAARLLSERASPGTWPHRLAHSSSAPSRARMCHLSWTAGVPPIMDCGPRSAQPYAGG